MILKAKVPPKFLSKLEPGKWAQVLSRRMATEWWQRRKLQSCINDLATYRGLADDEPPICTLTEQQEVGRLAMRLQRGKVIVTLRQGEDVWLVHAAADFKAATSRLLRPRIRSFLLDIGDEFIHAIRRDFEGDKQGDHGVE